MELEEQIKIVKILIEGVIDLGEFQAGWDDDVEKGYELLEHLESYDAF